MGDKCSNVGSDCSISVEDLAYDVIDALLQETFASTYLSVRFGRIRRGHRKFTEMNGVYCSSRPIHVGVATPRKATWFQQISSQGICSL